MWETKQATSASMAVIYITIGALIDVWTTVYYVFKVRGEQVSSDTHLWLSGFFFSGVVFIVVGLAVGRIGRSARQAEVTSLPPGTPVPVPAMNGAAPVAAVAQPANAVNPITAPTAQGLPDAPVPR